MSSKIQIIPDNRQGQLNTGFLGTIPGVLKIAEIVSFSSSLASSSQIDSFMQTLSIK